MSQAEYIKTRNILIVDPSSPSRLAVLKAMTDLGAERKNVVMVGTFDDAIADMNDRKPEIIIAEFRLEKKSCFELLALQAQYMENTNDKVFIMITRSTDESVVAEAAEEDVDAFVLKPFSHDTLVEYLKKTFEQKVNLSDYKKVVNDGKKFLAEKVIEGASLKFNEAKGLDQKPTLACYYLAQTQELGKNWDSALAEYENGLKFNPFHYKCLVGEFDVYDQLKKHTQAYQVIQKIVERFPISPKRLVKIFSLAVHTKNFNDIDKYYDYYTAMEHRPEELTRVVVGGLLVCGKFCLSQGNFEMAEKVFVKLAASSSRNNSVLEKVVQACLDFDQFKMADQFLRMFALEARENPEYLRLDFIIACRLNLPIAGLITKGYALIEAGTEDPWVYEKFIEMLLQFRKTNTAEEIAYKAAQKFPHRRESFLALIPKAS